MRRFTIGDLATATGTKAETIRYYEKTGLLTAPGRTRSNYRVYDDAEERRLVFIRRARDLGFSIQKVKELLALADDEHRSCGAVDALSRKRLQEVDQKIAHLKSLRRELASLLSQCRQGTVADCRIIEALAPARPPAP